MSTLANDCFKKASEGDAASQFWLGQCFEEGSEGFQQDSSKAMEWFLQAATQGHPEAQLSVAILFEEGRGVPQDYSKAFEWFLKAAEQGIAHAQFNVGWLYDEGKGVERNYKKALEWFLKASESGDQVAEYKVGTFYAKGKVVEQDDDKSFACFFLSKCAFARFEVFARFPSSETEYNFTEEFEWFLEYAEIGDTDAMYNLGVFYERGICVEKDLKKAFEWYKKAAQRDDSRAQSKLYEAYTVGLGVEVNDRECVYWRVRSLNTFLNFKFLYEPYSLLGIEEFSKVESVSSENVDQIDSEKEFVVLFGNQSYELCVKHLKQSKLLSKIISDNLKVLQEETGVLIDIGNVDTTNPNIVTAFNSYVKYLKHGSLPDDIENILKLIELAKFFGDGVCIQKLVNLSHILVRFCTLSLFSRTKRYHGAIITCFIMSETKQQSYGTELTKSVLKFILLHKDIAPVAKQHFIDMHFPNNPTRRTFASSNVFYMAWGHTEKGTKTIEFNNEKFEFEMKFAELYRRKLICSKKSQLTNRLQLYLQEEKKADNMWNAKDNSNGIWVNKFDDSDQTLFTTSADSNIAVVFYFYTPQPKK